MDILLAFWVTDVPLIVAGMFGGALRWAFLRPKVWDGVLNVVVGGILAYYASPFTVPFLAPILSGFTSDIPNIQRLSGLIVGIIGIGLIGFFLDVFKTRSKQLNGDQVVEPTPPTNQGE